LRTSVESILHSGDTPQFLNKANSASGNAFWKRFQEQLLKLEQMLAEHLAMEKGQELVTTPAERQVFVPMPVNNEAGVAPDPRKLIPPTLSSTPVPLSPTSLELAERTPIELDPLTVLKNALQDAGMDPEGLNLTVSKDTMQTPVNSWVNHSITAHFGDGDEQSYDVGLMLHNPKVTVVEIQRKLGMIRV
jgi:hypothetical protein